MPYPEQFPVEDLSEPSNLDENIDINFEQVADEVIKYYNKRPGFFSPYKNPYDFIDGLAAPVVLPACFGVASALFLAGSAVTGMVTAGSLIGAAGAALFDEDDLLVASLGVASVAAVICGGAALIGAGLAILTVLSIPFTLTEFVTRTLSTIVSPIIECCSSGELEEPEAPAYSYN